MQSFVFERFENLVSTQFQDTILMRKVLYFCCIFIYLTWNLLHGQLSQIPISRRYGTFVFHLREKRIVHGIVARKRRKKILSTVLVQFNRNNQSFEGTNAGIVKIIAASPVFLIARSL